MNGRVRTVLCAPDSYKGTIDAIHAAFAMGKGAERAGWGVDICPMSDGGDGFAQVLAAAGGRPRITWETTTVAGPLGLPVDAHWWTTSDGAVIESATASGLVLAGGALGNDPLRADTRGTGELIVTALRRGIKRLLVGVGGSASTDGGMGAVEVVLDAGGLGDAELVVACDVDIPFLEAAERFGPQKGASEAEVEQLSARLVALAAQYENLFGVDVTKIARAGAAGGLAGGLAALGARLVDGFGEVAERVDLAGQIDRAHLVITGEGRLDDLLVGEGRRWRRSHGAKRCASRARRRRGSRSSRCGHERRGSARRSESE